MPFVHLSMISPVLYLKNKEATRASECQPLIQRARTPKSKIARTVRHNAIQYYAIFQTI